MTDSSRKKIVIRSKLKPKIVIKSKNIQSSNYAGDLLKLSSNNKITIGSSSSDTIQLDSPLVEKHHITLERISEDKILLINHSSRGVYVKGKHVKKRIIINKRDRIQINSYEISPKNVSAISSGFSCNCSAINKM